MSPEADLDPTDAALVAALSTGTGDLSLEELAEQAEVPVTLLQAMEREGLLVRRGDGFSPEDAEAVQAGLALVEAGIPLAELLDLGRRSDDAMRGIAQQAVEVFMRFVRDPVQGTEPDEHAAARQLVAAFERMLPAAERVVAHHFRQLVLASARERLARELEGD